MKKKVGNRIEPQKTKFREYQRTLTFGEKMKIAFSLAERDKAIRLATPLKKVTNSNKD